MCNSIQLCVSAALCDAIIETSGGFQAKSGEHELQKYSDNFIDFGR